jgi:hypothetical protein
MAQLPPFETFPYLLEPLRGIDKAIQNAPLSSTQLDQRYTLGTDFFKVEGAGTFGRTFNIVLYRFRIGVKGLGYRLEARGIRTIFWEHKMPE